MKHIKDTNNTSRVLRTLNTLKNKQIKVGVFGKDNYKYDNDADLVTIAHVHEFGADINLVKAKWLTIPINSAAKGKRARDFSGLFFYQPKGKEYAFLARKKGKKGIENLFLLMKSVKIPERSFLRSGYDAHEKEIADKIFKLLPNVLAGAVPLDTFLDAVGLEFAGKIQSHAKKLRRPGNAEATKATKGSSNPLYDTGRMIGAIRHEVK